MRLAIKIDVDTYRGLREGGPRLASYLHTANIPASFFVTMGPDTSGQAGWRVFRQPGFWTKMRRSQALSHYGWRTALSGTLFPARPIAVSFAPHLRQWKHLGFEVSPHGFDHVSWHDRAARWSAARAEHEMDRIEGVYRSIFGEAPQSFAAPGWQAGPGCWQAMAARHLLYHSDTRGERPYFPLAGGKVFKTLEIPTTLPSWDEMLAWDDVTPENLVARTMALLDAQRTNVWTIHAEFEGGSFFHRFQELVEHVRAQAIEWVFLPDYARQLLRDEKDVAIHPIRQAAQPGRAGTVTCQAA